VLTVANFNMHAGVDGWGRAFDPIPVCQSFGADVLVLEEAWTSNGHEGDGQAEQIAKALGARAFTCTMAEGIRTRPNPDATSRWKPRVGLRRTGGHALYFDCQRPLSDAVRAQPRVSQGERGTWGIAVIVRDGLEVDDTHTVHLPQLKLDRVRRAAVVVDLQVDGAPISVVGTHMSHLHMGSHRHYAALRDELRTQARPDAVLSGDMNLWGPPVTAFFTEWHRAVRGRTWPTWSPHSQIDHILVRGRIQVTKGEVLPHAGSDHRPVRAELSIS
jgi:endonuclease/exonuclease/phosphatase family metal-dependent hydrolase